MGIPLGRQPIEAVKLVDLLTFGKFQMTVEAAILIFPRATRER